MSEELKPCPFCKIPGRQEKQRNGPNGERRGTVTGCFNLACKIMPLMRHEDDQSEAAIAAWNQRAKPVVKALEWNSAQSGMWKSGHYSVWHQWASDGKFHASVNTGERNYHKIGVGYASLDEAKAAAQADFTRRVHACLEGCDHVED